MDFSFTEEQQAFRQSVRDFMQRECPPKYARQLDENEEYPFELYAKMADLGRSPDTSTDRDFSASAIR